MKKPENLPLRTTTAIVFGILVIGSLLLGQWYFAGLMLFVVIAGLLEFYNLISKEDLEPQKIIGIIGGTIVYGIIILVNNDIINPQFTLLLVVLPAVSIGAEMVRKRAAPFQNVGLTLVGILYLAIPMGLLVSFFPIGLELGFDSAGILILGFFIILWVFDSAAYFVGSAIGKHKLCERFSPKKTWEGMIGGMLFGLITAFVLSLIYKQISVLHWLVMTLIIMIFGTLGDLAESMLKRSVNVKDSGRLLPGHGGILDRFDAVLLSVPFLYVYIRFFL
ncbi:MAG: CDP-archaeol synthase [Bacteroidales bacterium]|nr:CDP-archaeol synthase [Bacteroidales bacterium]